MGSEYSTFDNTIVFKYADCSEAAGAGDLSELKKMRNYGYTWDTDTTKSAAENGHLKCLKWAHEHGCEWNSSTPSSAAKNGHLNCLRYAHKNNCIWGSRTPEYAAQNGHLDCLKYAHSHGCPWDEWAPYFAAKNGHYECFKYCFERWFDPQVFWKSNHDLVKIIDKIDLDDPVWRKLLNLNLRIHPLIQNKVQEKKHQLQQMKHVSAGALNCVLPDDLVKHCIWEYF